MNILDNCQLTDDEVELLMPVINYFGLGAHPYVTEESIYFFTPNYAIECLAKAIESASLNPFFPMQRAKDLKAKLEAHQATFTV